MNTSIERLLHTTLPAHHYQSTSKSGHPVVRIYALNGEQYEGMVVTCTNNQYSEKSNFLREQLRERDNLELMVYTIGIDQGRLTVVAASEIEEDISLELASEVTTSNHVKYGVFVGQAGKRPVVKYWDEETEGWEQKYATLDAPLTARQGTLEWANHVVGKDFIYGSTQRKNGLLPNQNILMRKRLKKQRFTHIMEPVITLTADDNVYDEEEKPVITRIDGYIPGSQITNIPILTLQHSFRDNSIAGVGRLPKEHEQGFKLKPVVVLGAADYLGKWVPKATLLSYDGPVALARVQK